MCQADVILKHKNVSSIEEYNIGDRLKYSRIKQSSKKDIEESRINVKYQEHYRSIWNSTKCKMQSVKCNIETSGIIQSTKRGAKLQSKGIIRTKAKFWYIPLHSFSVLCSFLIGVSLVQKNVYKKAEIYRSLPSLPVTSTHLFGVPDNCVHSPLLFP